MAVLFLAASALLLGLVLRGVTVQGWKETPCVIIHSGVEAKWDSVTVTSRSRYMYRFEVAYEYTFGGTHYSGNRYNLDPSWSSSSAGARELAKRYRIGMQETCRVNPDKPSESILEPTFPLSMWLLIPGLFVAATGYGLIRAIRHREPLVPPTPREKIDHRRFM